MRHTRIKFLRHLLPPVTGVLTLVTLAQMSACSEQQSVSKVEGAPLVLHYDSLLTFAQDGGFNYLELADAQGDAGAATDNVTLRVDWGTEPPPASGSAAVAYWIDAYNGSAITGALAHFPVKSVRDIPDYFSGPRYTFGDELLSLDQIEKEKLLGTQGDARIHFAIVCASRGCPPLWPEPFREASDLDSLLDLLTEGVVNDSYYVALDFTTGRVSLSRLFDWYRSDFERQAGSLVQFIARYHVRGAEIAEREWQISFREYDWSLNQIPKPPPSQ